MATVARLYVCELVCALAVTRNPFSNSARSHIIQYLFGNLSTAIAVKLESFELFIELDDPFCLVGELRIRHECVCECVIDSTNAIGLFGICTAF